MKFETYVDDQGQYRWTLIASNGEALAVASEGYARAEDRDHAIKLIRENAITARVVRVS